MAAAESTAGSTKCRNKTDTPCANDSELYFHFKRSLFTRETSIHWSQHFNVDLKTQTVSFHLFQNNVLFVCSATVLSVARDRDWSLLLLRLLLTFNYTCLLPFFLFLVCDVAVPQPETDSLIQQTFCCHRTGIQSPAARSPHVGVRRSGATHPKRSSGCDTAAWTTVLDNSCRLGFLASSWVRVQDWIPGPLIRNTNQGSRSVTGVTVRVLTI